MNKYEHDKKILDQINVLTCSFKQGAFTYLSPNWEGVLGWPIATLMAKPVISLTHAKDRAFIEEISPLHTNHSTTIKNFKNRFLTSSGSYKWLEWTASRGEDGEWVAVVQDVSERIDWTEESFSADSLLAQASNMAELGHWKVNLQDQSLEWSEAVFNIHSLNPLEYKPTLESAISFYHPDDAPKVAECVQRAINQKSGFSFQLRLIRSDGELRQVRAKGDVQCDLSGNAIAIFGTFQDVTENCRLIDENDMLSHVARTITTGVVITDSKKRVEWVNEAFEHITGYSLRDVKGQTLGPFLHGAGTDHVSAMKISDKLNEGGVIDQEILNYKKSGEPYWNQLLIHPLYENGLISKYIGVQHDITKRKLAEIELKKSELRYRNVVETIQEVIYQVDHEGRIFYINSFWETLTGFSVEASLGKKFVDFFIGEQLQELKSFYVAFSQQGHTQKIGKLSLIDYLGDCHFVELRQNTYKNNEGQYFYQGTIVDNTEYYEQKDMLMHANRLETMGGLIAGICHDFNNILGIIQGNSELLKAKCDNPSSERFVNNIYRATERGSALTKKLLKSSKRKRTEITKIDLGACLMEMQEMLLATIPNNVFVHFDVGKDIFCRTNQPELEDCLLNLIINAHNAIEGQGDIHVVAEITCSFNAKGYYTIFVPEPSDQYILLSINDTGVGMHPDSYSQIFMPFYTKGGGQGNGLGLSMVAGFVSRHGYGLTVDSELGRGTEFILWMPLEDLSRFVDVPVEHELALRVGDRVFPKRVVLVDDEQMILDTLRSFLEQHGAIVYSYIDGQKALDALEDKAFEVDLVITDEIMPGRVQGHDLILWTQNYRPRTKILLMTGFIDEVGDSLLKVNKLHKPFSLDALKESILNLVNTD